MASVSKNRQGKWTVRYRDAQDRQHSKVIPGPKANALKLKADARYRHVYPAERDVGIRKLEALVRPGEAKKAEEAGA